jgi:ABC-2 type transport system permease protein
MKTIIYSIYQVTKREIHRMAGNRLYFFAVLLFPLITIVFFGSFFREGVPTRMPIAVVDLDQTILSRKFIRNIDVTQLSSVTLEMTSVSEAMSSMRKGDIYGFVVIPAGLQADIMRSERPQLSFYYHNGLLITGGLMQNDLTLTLHTLSAGINKQRRESRGLSGEALLAGIQPIQVNTHQLFNPTSNYSVYISTIVMPIMLQLFILMMTVYSIGIEIRQRTSREWLRSGKKSLVLSLTGKLLPYTFIFTCLMFFQNFVLFKVLQVPMHCNPFTLTLASLLFVLAYQAIGVFCIGLLPLMRHSLNLAGFYGILALTLCGFSFPIESMPPVFQYWASGFPVRHYMHIFQSQVLAGFEAGYSLPSYLFLMVFMMLPLLIYSRLKSALIYQNFIEEIHNTSIAPQPHELPEVTESL